MSERNPEAAVTNVEVTAKVTSIIREYLGVEPVAVTPQASFIEDLNADSLDVLEMLMAIESEYAIEISDDESASIRTVADATALVVAKLAARS